MHVTVIECRHDKRVGNIFFKQIKIGKLLGSGFIDS